MRKKERIAYVDSWLETYWPPPWGYSNSRQAPEYRQARKTVAHLRKSYVVNTWTAFNEQTAREIAERHRKRPYRFLITELERDNSKVDDNYIFYAYLRCYNESAALLRRTMKMLPGAEHIVYIDEAADVVEFVLEDRLRIGPALQKWLYSEVQKERWKAKLGRLDAILAGKEGWEGKRVKE